MAQLNYAAQQAAQGRNKSGLGFLRENLGGALGQGAETAAMGLGSLPQVQSLLGNGQQMPAILNNPKAAGANLKNGIANPQPFGQPAQPAQQDTLQRLSDMLSQATSHRVDKMSSGIIPTN